MDVLFGLGWRDVFEAVPFLELDEDDFRQVLDINLLGSFRLSKEVALRMQQGGGRILFLSPIHAKSGIKGRLACGASKAGVEAMTRTIAAEMSVGGVRVNALACGAVDTGMSATKALRTDWTGATPAGRARVKYLAGPELIEPGPVCRRAKSSDI